MIYITGVGRSGTSLVAQLYSAARYNLGKNPLSKYYEDPRVQTLNDDIISDLGGSSFFYPFAKWIRPDDQFYTQAKKIISDNRIVMKDPRFSILLPFWEEVAIPTKEVIALRDPDAVVESFYQRDGLSYERGYDLYSQYMSAAFSNFKDPVIINYDSWFKIPKRNLELLGLDKKVDHREVVSKDLNHFTKTNRDMFDCSNRVRAWEVYVEVNSYGV